MHSRTGDVRSTYRLYSKRFTRCPANGDGVAPDSGTFNILISTCARAAAHNGAADRGGGSDASSYSSDALLKLAFAAYAEMIEDGIAPDVITLASLLHTCGNHAPPASKFGAFGEGGQTAEAADAARQHTEKVLALYETSVPDLRQTREKAALARCGLHTIDHAIAPNPAVFSALIGAIFPDHLPSEVQFVLSQAEVHSVKLNSFVLLNLTRRLESVRVDRDSFSIETRPEVVEAAGVVMRYAERHGIANQPKGKDVMKSLRRLAAARVTM